MKLQAYNYRLVAVKGIKYFLLIILGLIIILSLQFNSTCTSTNKRRRSLFLLFITYLYAAAKSPFHNCRLYSRICLQAYPHGLQGLILIFPTTSIIEGFVYKGSQNLIPIVFAIHFWFALPSIIAAFIGRFIFRQITKPILSAFIASSAAVFILLAISPVILALIIKHDKVTMKSVLIGFGISAVLLLLLGLLIASALGSWQ